MSVKMHISPTLLDKFQAWQESECSWEEYYGQSEEPSCTMAEWDEKLEQDLIDACNGVETPSSRAADLGTCLNEAIDCLLLKVKSTRDDVVLKSDRDAITAQKGDNTFLFHVDDLVNLKGYVEGYIPQALVSANIDTSRGPVQLYGYPDYFNKHSVIDLKSTSRYESGKFRYKWQRLVYPYILNRTGGLDEYRFFEFLVCKCSGETKVNPFVEMELYHEIYTDPIASFDDIIRGQVERFIDWYDQNRDKGLINDRLVGERPIK